jgi:glycosyltransferase involved in cell wall biosynthesis
MARRVLVCSNLYPPDFVGGAELIAHEQAKALMKLGCQVATFAGTVTAEGPLYSLTHGVFEGIPVHRVKVSSGDFQADVVNFANESVESHFANVLADFQPDVVHFHNLAGLSTLIIGMAREFGAATVLTLHDHWGFCVKTTLLKTHQEICRDHSRCFECIASVRSRDGGAMPIAERNSLVRRHFLNVGAFISPSFYQAQAQVSAGLPIGRVHVIANGIDVQRFSRVAKTPDVGRLRLTYIGYMGHHKGVGNLIAALALMEEPSRFHLNLVGDGALREQMREQVIAAGLIDSVRFWGRVDPSAIETVHAQTDVLVLPSVCPENQPVSITEAMACRTPVIASRIGGIPELVADGETGWLFEPTRPADLAAKIKWFLDHPPRLQEMGEKGSEKIVDQTFFNQAEKILRLYSRLR